MGQTQIFRFKESLGFVLKSRLGPEVSTILVGWSYLVLGFKFKFRVARVVSPLGRCGPSGPGPRSPGRTPPPGWNAGTLD